LTEKQLATAGASETKQILSYSGRYITLSLGRIVHPPCRIACGILCQPPSCCINVSEPPAQSWYPAADRARRASYTPHSSHPPHSIIIPPSYTPHAPLIHNAHTVPSQTPDKPLIYLSYTPRTPRIHPSLKHPSHTPHTPLIHPSYTPHNPSYILTPLIHPSQTPHTLLMHCMHWRTPRGAGPLSPRADVPSRGTAHACSSRRTELIQPSQHLLLPRPTGVGAHADLVPRVACRVVLPHPLQHLQLPVHGRPYASGRAPRTAVLPRLLCSTSWCPPRAANTGVAQPHGQWCSLAHCNTARCPPAAAANIVTASNGQPMSCSHSNTSWLPPRAAYEQAVFKHSGGRWYSRRTGGVLFARLAHCMSAVAATAAAHPRPAPPSEARSLGPSRRRTSV